MTPPPRRISQALALALLAALLAGGVFGVLVPIRDRHAALDARIDQTRTRLARYQDLAAQQPRLAEALEAIEARQRRAGVLLDGATAAVAGSRLQERLNRIVENAGGRVRSLQSLPVETEQALRRVGVRAQLSGGIGVLRDVLYAVETGRPFLFVEALDVRRQPGYARPENGPATAELLIRLEVVGYLAGDGT